MYETMWACDIVELIKDDIEIVVVIDNNGTVTRDITLAKRGTMWEDDMEICDTDTSDRVEWTVTKEKKMFGCVVQGH